MLLFAAWSLNQWLLLLMEQMTRFSRHFCVQEGQSSSTFWLWGLMHLVIFSHRCTVTSAPQSECEAFLCVKQLEEAEKLLTQSRTSASDLQILVLLKDGSPRGNELLILLKKQKTKNQQLKQPISVVWFPRLPFVLLTCVSVASAAVVEISALH